MAELLSLTGLPTFRDPAGSIEVRPDGAYRSILAPFDKDFSAADAGYSRLGWPPAHLADTPRWIEPEEVYPGTFAGFAVPARHYSDEDHAGKRKL
jgi:hypothetical protein